MDWVAFWNYFEEKRKLEGFWKIHVITVKCKRVLQRVMFVKCGKCDVGRLGGLLGQRGVGETWTGKHSGRFVQLVFCVTSSCTAFVGNTFSVILWSS